MKFTIKKDELLRALKRVQGIVEGSNVIPILSNILIAAKNSGVTVAATNLEMTLLGDYQAVVEQEGRVVVPAKKLYEVCREIPGDEAVFSVGDAHRLSVVSGNAKFKLVGIDPGEYPELPAIPETDMILMDSNELVSLLRKTIYAVSPSDSRYVLTGLRIEIVPLAGNGSSSVKTVGTDGHRLAMVTKTIKSSGKTVGCIVPKKALSEIVKIFDEDSQTGEVAFGVTKNQAIFRRNGVVFFCKLIDGEYPNYQQVIPKDNPNTVDLPRAALASALKRVSVIASEKSRAIKFDFAPGKLTLSMTNADLGDANEEMPIEYNGAPVVIGMNGMYMLEALNSMSSEKVTVKMNDGVSPCLVTDGTEASHLCVVMPLRL